MTSRERVRACLEWGSVWEGFEDGVAGEVKQRAVADWAAPDAFWENGEPYANVEADLAAWDEPLPRGGA